jgi:hypothetical protein
MAIASRTDNPARDMAAIMAKARNYSDSRLADVLAGKDMSIPQYVAMTEAMGRKQLRQAVDGQQAMQQAQQPSVKEQLLAEQRAPQMAAGIDQLPAANMESIDMASGGIIAFEKGGGVGRYADDPLSYLSGLGSESMAEDEIRREKELRKYKELYGFEKFPNAPVAAPVAAAPAAAPAAPAVNPNAPAAPATEKLKLDAGKDSGKDTGIPAIAERKDFLGQYEGTGARMREGIAALKDAKQSDILLGAAEALLTNPTLAQAAGKAAGKTSQIGAQARREEREIGKAADEYEFNLAKAREAAAQGNQDLAYKYAALADQAKYRAGILGIKGQELGMQKDMYDMVKVPAQLSKVYADATKAVKDATANRPVKPAEFQKLVDEEYRKRATGVGLGKFIDTYSPSTSLSTVSQLPKGVSAMKLPDDA